MKALTAKLASTHLKMKHRSDRINQSDPLRAQEKLFRKMKNSLRETSIYHDLCLESLNSYEDYVAKVTPRDYKFYQPYIERIRNGEKNILYRDPTKYLAVTSGTSGYNSKVIPYNGKMMKTLLNYQKKFAAAIMASEPQANPITCKRFTYGSHGTNLDCRSSVPTGYISGIIASEMPRTMLKNVFPSPDILRTTDWQEKIKQITEQVRQEDIRVLSGVPGYLTNIFEDLLSILKAKTLSEIWPNLEVFVYSGTHIQNFRKRLNRLAGRNLKYFGAYISTEAPIGYSWEPDGDFVFNIDSVLLSFNSVNDPGATNLGIHELVRGEEYLVNVGTPNGILQYEMKDIVKITQTDPIVTFQISGRKNTAMNVATEKISQNEINRVIESTERELQIDVNHYFLYPSENSSGKTCYEWSVILNRPEEVARESMAESLDKHLMELSEDYRDCRLNDGVIAEPKVHFVPKALGKAYFLKFNSRGQLKMKTILDSKKSFLNLIEQIYPAYLTQARGGDLC